MRPARQLAGMAMILVLASVGRGQQAPFDATVAMPEVEVRSGPSPQFYATTKLRQGTSVHVLEEKDGWLAIAPPAGSFSWINNRLIDRNGRTAVVLTDAPVRIGSSVSNAPPTVEQVTLARGAQVIIMGEPYSPQEEQPAGKWWPIQPPPQERRYIPKDAVRTTAAVETVAAAAPTGQPQDKGAWPTPGTPPQSPASGSPLMDQARQAETAGNVPKAIELYTQVYRQSIDSNHGLAMEALNRVHYLQSGNQGSVPPGYRPGVPAEATAGQAANRIAPVPAQTTSNTQVGYGGRPQPTPIVQPSGPGRLRRAGFFVDGKQAYVLENSQGRPLLYVTAQAGLNLEPYVNRTVELFGPTVYHGDLRTNYMSAAQVNLIP